MITLAFKEMDRKADANSHKVAFLGVQALLNEGAFIKELIQYQLSHPGQPLPNEFIEKMHAAMQKTVNAFLDQR